MPSKPNDLKSLFAQWKKGAFHSVYYFAGPDTLQKDEALMQLQKAFLAGDDSGFNIDKFDGETADAAQVLNAVQTLAFLGGRRLVVLRRVQEMAAADKNRLADALPKLPEANCLVILSDEKADARSVLVQAVKSVGVVHVFWTPFENQMPAWVAERAQVMGKEIKREAVHALLEAVGPNLQDLSHELEKLCLYVNDRKTIELSDVEASGGQQKTLQFMEWDRAFWQKDSVKALGLLNMMRSQGQPPEALLAQLVRIFQKIFLGKTLVAEKKQSEMWDRLWIRLRQPQQEFQQALSLYSWKELMTSLEKLLQAERDLKTGRLNPQAGMTLLVAELCGEK